MKALLLFTGGGPMVVLSSHAAPDDEVFLEKLKAKGVDQFMAWELPMGEVEAKYGTHFETVVHDLHETDDLRVLDVNGHRVFELFRIDALKDPFVYEPRAHPTKVYLD